MSLDQIPLHIWRFSAPRDSLRGMSIHDGELHLVQWRDDGRSASVAFVGNKSALLFDDFIGRRTSNPFQLFSAEAQPKAEVIDSARWEVMCGPRPWFELLLNLALPAASTFLSSDLYLAVESADEFARLRSLQQPYNSDRPTRKSCLPDLGIQTLDDLTKESRREFEMLSELERAAARMVLESAGLRRE